MTEKTLHNSICNFIRYKYPGVMFNSDLSGSFKLPIHLAAALKSLRSNRGYPDIVIYEPRGEYHGMFLELKREGEKVLNKSGKPATPHILEQQNCMAELAERGYFCAFGVGIDACMKLIDEYLKL